jgi:bidirectional [NiFe] hydrogenase diaphorase subunit
MGVVTLTINGVECTGKEGQTVLEVAKENGINIPTLCNLKGLSPVTACRLCLIEVKGMPRLVPACATKVQEGMVVETNSEKLKNYRRLIVELLFAEGNHISIPEVKETTMKGIELIKRYMDENKDVVENFGNFPSYFIGLVN